MRRRMARTLQAGAEGMRSRAEHCKCVGCCSFVSPVGGLHHGQQPLCCFPASESRRSWRAALRSWL